MAQHYKWYPASEETVVPWNARYAFPSMSNKATKVTARIPPKNGANFSPSTGDTIRLEFPAQGYINPGNTTIEFEVVLTNPATAGANVFNFQNNIQSIFRRVRVLYGSTVIEDILEYNVLVRHLTEWTSTNQTGSMDQTSITEGIGGYVAGVYDVSNVTTFEPVHVRRKYIQGYQGTANAVEMTPNTSLAGSVNGCFSVQRYVVSLATGLFTQDKLIPTKFMASQLAIELQLAQPSQCIFMTHQVNADAPTYSVQNVNLITEILDFDDSYDAAFLEGLRTGGVPIKFATWHTFNFSMTSTSTNLQIQERSRSVKALFAIQRITPASFTTDSGAGLFASGTNGVMTDYQYRIGGRFFPAQPVICSQTNGGVARPQGAESFIELQKALNVLGDYRLSPSVNYLRWAQPYQVGLATDYKNSIANWDITTGAPLLVPGTSGSGLGTADHCGTLGSACFAAAVSLETSSGMEISGLNAEEQSDISLTCHYSIAQDTANTMTVFSYFDAMLIIRENNVVELIM